MDAQEKKRRKRDLFFSLRKKRERAKYRESEIERWRIKVETEK